MLFGNSEVHFWSYEGSENGKLQKVSPKGNYKEKCLGLHESTTFSDKPNAFGPFCGNVGWQEKVSQGGGQEKVSQGGLLATSHPLT